MSLTVGVDIGGTKIASGVVDEKGTILEQGRIPTPSHDAAQLRAVIVGVVQDLRTRHDVTGVGLGAAGFVAADRRRVYFAPNLDFGTEPLADILQDALGIPVGIENDGNAAAWAEFRFGAGQGIPDQLMVALGTGVGGGLILGGELYRGGHGVAAEIGHIGVVRDGIPCNCGRRGCLEQYSSGGALQRDARIAAAAGRAPALLKAAGGDPQAITGGLVTELAQSGDPGALELFTLFADSLGVGIASLVAVLDPTLIILGGGVSEAGDVLLTPTRRALEREITGAGNRPYPELRIAHMGNDAGLIGAADLARLLPA